MKKQILGVAGAVVLALGCGTASALSVGTIVAGSTTPTNQGVDIVYAPATSASGFFGARWALVGGPAIIDVVFLGKEAGDANKFTITGTSGTVSCTNGIGSCDPSGFPGGMFSATGTAVGSVTANSGLLDFSFIGLRGTVSNLLSNPDVKLGQPGVNFFSRIASAGCIPTLATPCYSGTVLDLWFDDLGGARASDDNHDDMVIRLSLRGGSFEVVPIPAALPLLLSGLAGLGFIARRRRVVAA